MNQRAAAAYVAICSAALAQFASVAASETVDPTYSVLDFHGLTGWTSDDQQAALSVFLNTCGDMKGVDWQTLCLMAKDQSEQDGQAKTFFELFFRPVLIQDGSPALFTGYYEPELDGSRTRTSRFRYPVYRLPPDVTEGVPWLTRREIEEGNALAGRGLEIAWVDDPVELLFLQIQGSGRILLQDGSHIRLGYAGNNGQDYRSIGKEMVRREIYEPHQVSAKVIGNWVRRNPIEGAELLRHNPSFVFFRVLDDVPSEAGPKGAMNRSITPGRSLAIDPQYIPLGAPVWIEKKGFREMRRLMVAQDTGSAIKGPQRADVFMGTGAGAGREAGRMKDAGRMVVLLPIQRAYAMMVEDAP
ncbi:murein transglycosylase [Pseudooceanicola sediminis]|uniref:peptidoglycan lytic exotransglycosylase n=1 Tax=Pseudooceanicola sediminis TaxID=2211117 RepID=A0A399JCH5_9RHOB|nr:MltA domain-containing protein [Pseudooceanicola sediminis]KAA2315457.1 murein transglycosylase [Puniceibacterium sp. HSS470]RII40336.1 murein transglycosylase [Pseudooceanicola sediminis]|tara:strand:- start:31645 stop:32715 length:1071 start_codon:yes stop_codon:yes gene_type:complete